MLELCRTKSPEKPTEAIGKLHNSFEDELSEDSAKTRQKQRDLMDYNEFEKKRLDREYWLPSEILFHNRLEIDKWKNIPVPVSQACKLFERSLQNTSRLLKYLFTDLQARDYLTVNIFTDQSFKRRKDKHFLIHQIKEVAKRSMQQEKALQSDF